MIDFVEKRIYHYSPTDYCKVYGFENCELMQFTGLKDVVGKEIFEGDIIVIPDKYPFYDENKINYIGYVEFIYSQWQYVFHCVNSNKKGVSHGINNALNDYGFEEDEYSYYKILGNIYQNSELLEKK